MPRLEEWEIKKYWQIFQGLKPEGNKLTGEKVSPVLKNSRLPDSQLSQIWDLSDIDADGKLDFEEFCITLRLIFDTVNGNTSEIPEELPSWLIPLSKAHLILANRAVATGSNSSTSVGDEDDDLLSDDFDWYISPTDKATYETIYNSNCDSYGRVRYDSLDGLYQTLRRVPRSDLSSAWNLVNPKSFETIDKDQVLVYLHILNQRENGKRIPRGVPASLRATFSKEVPKYDLSSASKTISEPSSNDKKSFGTNYLNKIGQGHHSEKGTDFSVTEGTDWELVRLRRELANLESLLDKAQTETNQNADGELAVLKFEFEQLLKYKQDKLKSLRSVPDSDKDLTDVKNDVELISTQVQTLEEFLVSKEEELARLKAELA